MNSLPLYQLYFWAILLHLFGFIILTVDLLKLSHSARKVVGYLILVFVALYHVLIVNIFKQYREYPSSLGSCQKFYTY
jgi:hypothetical protein